VSLKKIEISDPLCRQAGGFFLGAACALVSCVAPAQGYPTKAIRLIATQPPGAGTDRAARIIGQRLAVSLGQQIVVDNRGGASGNIATELVAKALPDGYTLLITTPAHAINPGFNPSVSYDPVKDFAPITQLTAQAFLIVVHPSVPAKSVKELIAFSKGKKGGMTYGTAGIGVTGHLAMELLTKLGRFEAAHVPYKGGGPAIVDLIAGQVDAAIVSLPALLPHVRSGKANAIAVTSLQRSVHLPDVPTVSESGFPGYEVTSWYGLLAPARTPKSIVSRLYEEVSAILKAPEIRSRLAADGAEPVGTTPEQFTEYIKAEVIKWARVAKESGAKIN
jgi:tripartite-type tricarboxylate transporter receptor subunit TctC